MEDVLLLDAAERYMKGSMNQQEKLFFEELRKNNPELDQMVVEQTFFLNEVEQYGDLKAFKHSLHEVDTKLAEEGIIRKSDLRFGGKVVYIWKKYKRTVMVAASIAGIVSMLTVALASVYNNSKSNNDLTKLSREIDRLKADNINTNKKLDDVKRPKAPNAPFISGGTGFLIDAKGYMITNAHVLKGKTIVATNQKGEQFLAKICMKDENRDIAILKIDDKDFKPFTSLPYSINK